MMDDKMRHTKGKFHMMTQSRVSTAAKGFREPPGVTEGSQGMPRGTKGCFGTLKVIKECQRSSTGTSVTNRYHQSTES